MRFLLFILSSFFAQLPFHLSAQTSPDWLEQARQDVATLSSDEFAGRGYINQGHLLAAQFIGARFESLGLTPLVPQGKEVNGFFQHFSLQINLIKDGSLIVDGKALQPGFDFIGNKYSGSEAAAGNVIDLGYGLEKKRFKKAKGKIVVIRAGWPEAIANDSDARAAYKGLEDIMQRIMAVLPSGPKGFVILQPKLTHGFVQESIPYPIVEVKAEAWPEGAREVEISIESGRVNVMSQNVIGYLPGTCATDEVVVVCAHYDHLGRFGKAVFAGANDNASGTAMLLSMAAYFADSTHRPERNMLFIAFGGEEVGLLGSNYYANQNPVVPLSRMAFLLNLDLMGNGVDGIMAVGGKTFPEEFAQLEAINDTLQAVPKVRARTNAPNSDHYWFLEKGVTGFFIYTMGGPSHYHDVYDTAENLELSRYLEVRELLIRFLEKAELSCDE